jgi:tetratricopeptide (TPR) repeat protein
VKIPQILKNPAVFSLALAALGAGVSWAQDNGAPQAVFLKAVGAFNAGKYPKAQDGFQAVLKDDPDNLKAHFYLGLIKYEQNFLSEASAYFQWAVNHDPQNPVVFYYLGRIAYDQGNWNNAVSELLIADQLDPGISMVHYYLGLSRYKLGDLPGSKEQFLEALELEPSLSKAHYALAYLYLHDLKDNKSAKSEIKAGLKGKPDPKLMEKFLRLKKLCGRK